MQRICVPSPPPVSGCYNHWSYMFTWGAESLAQLTVVGALNETCLLSLV